MTLWVPLGIGLLAILGLVFSERRRHQKLLARLRAEWSRPSERTRDIQAISLYHRNFAEAHEHPLDERTAKDLDLDAVFANLDRTVSITGQQLLYHRLRTTPTSENLTAFETLMTRLAEDPAERERIQVSLSRLQWHSVDVWVLAEPGALDVRRRDVMFPFLALVVPIALLLSAIWPVAFGVMILGIIANMTVRYLTAPRLGPLLRPFRQVAPLLAVAETTVPLIETHGSRINPSLSSDLAKLSRLRRIAGWVSRSPMDSDDYTAAVFELANMILLLDMNLLVFASRELRTHGPSLLRVVATVGNVDAAISLASYRAGTMAWTRPVFQSQLGGSTMIGLRHPLLAEAVPNSIELAPPHGVLITGSNMSGKSTFLRTVGVNAILAQTLNTCLATAYRAPVFTVRSVIRRSDDLLAGKSYYRDEIDAVIALVHASQSRLPHLFLFDELFRGTGTVERIAAAEATLRELVTSDEDGQTSSQHVVIAATHDRELVELLQRTFASYHFSDTVDSDGLAFDYQLRKGAASSWNAIALLELCGAPQRIVERALARTAGLSDQRRLGQPAVDRD